MNLVSFLMGFGSAILLIAVCILAYTIYMGIKHGS